MLIQWIQDKMVVISEKSDVTDIGWFGISSLFCWSTEVFKSNNSSIWQFKFKLFTSINLWICYQILSNQLYLQNRKPCIFKLTLSWIDCIWMVFIMKIRFLDAVHKRSFLQRLGHARYKLFLIYFPSSRQFSRHNAPIQTITITSQKQILSLI